MTWSRRPKPARAKYGAEHRAARRAWAAHLELAGPVPCTRCRQPVHAGQAWHLDHADDGVRYLGPAHASCNVRAGARRGALVANAQRSTVRTSRAWLRVGRDPLLPHPAVTRQRPCLPPQRGAGHGTALRVTLARRLAGWLAAPLIVLVPPPVPVASARRLAGPRPC